MKTPGKVHWLGLIFALLLLLGFALPGNTSQALGKGKGSGNHPQHVAPLANSSSVGSTNPIAFGAPVVIPGSRPTTVTVLKDQAFGNAPPPAQSTVALPAGNWQQVVLTITGSQKGRQFDRLLLIWAGNTQIFTGVTPEPTQAGIAWAVRKDVTAYLPLLKGTQTFTTWIDNYVTSVYTGIPVVSVTLSFYPRGGHGGANTPGAWNLDEPGTIVPLTSTPDMVTVHPNQALTATLDLPNDVTRAYLDLYAIAQINDEFWWAQVPAFRELEVAIDGRPAGLVWPFPFVYTGGVNPYLWRPISAINTLNMPSYRLDLTPFAGLLGGHHTITVSVFNNQDYWLLAGSLFLDEDHDHPTSGAITMNTLSFPSAAPSTTTPLIGSTNPSSNNQIDVTASRQYEIRGTIHTGRGTFTATVSSSLNFSNDQLNINPDAWEVVHGFQEVVTDESLAGPGVGARTWHSDEMYTIDTATGFVQTPQSQSAFLLPANLSQTLNVVDTAHGPGLPTYQSALHLNLESFANYQAGDPAANIPAVTLGSTTAYANFETNRGLSYHLVLAARGGAVTMDQLQANFQS